jgi:hypothetical protein
MAGEQSGDAAGGSSAKDFGACCTELKDAMSGEEFEPLITVSEDGILYMSVGLVELDEDEPGMVDHPLFFCPFCGKGLQTVEDVRAKSGEDLE